MNACIHARAYMVCVSMCMHVQHVRMLYVYIHKSQSPSEWCQGGTTTATTVPPNVCSILITLKNQMEKDFSSYWKSGSWKFSSHFPPTFQKKLGYKCRTAMDTKSLNKRGAGNPPIKPKLRGKFDTAVWDLGPVLSQYISISIYGVLTVLLLTCNSLQLFFISILLSLEKVSMAK